MRVESMIDDKCVFLHLDKSDMPRTRKMKKLGK